MGVKTHCNGCGDDYDLGARVMADGGITTACPGCGDTSYGTYADGIGTNKSQRELVEQAISVKGVGKKTRRNLHERYAFFAELEAADLDEIVEVEGVGRGNGERILAKVAEMSGDL